MKGVLKMNNQELINELKRYEVPSRVINEISAKLGNVLSDAGIDIINYMEEHKDVYFMSNELAVILNLPLKTVVGVLTSLYNRGYISKNTDDETGKRLYRFIKMDDCFRK